MTWGMFFACIKFCTNVLSRVYSCCLCNVVRCRIISSGCYSSTGCFTRVWTSLQSCWGSVIARSTKTGGQWDCSLIILLEFAFKDRNNGCLYVASGKISRDNKTNNEDGEWPISRTMSYLGVLDYNDIVLDHNLWWCSYEFCHVNFSFSTVLCKFYARCICGWL